MRSYTPPPDFLYCVNPDFSIADCEVEYLPPNATALICRSQRYRSSSRATWLPGSCTRRARRAVLAFLVKERSITHALRTNPDRYEHLVRYAGWYSNRARGERAKVLEAQQPATTAPADEAAVSEFISRAKAPWARLIRKVYEADPLVCPKCNAPMRVIALIDDPGVVRRILEHLGRWAPEPAERGPPAAPDWPRNAVIPITYHPLPDIA